MINQEDPIERLARLTAEENDRLARQRYDELTNPAKYWTPKQKRGNNIAIWVCLGVLAAIFINLMIIFNH